MVTRHLSKNPPSEYEIGEQILIKLLISDKKIRGIKKTFDIVKGEIVDLDANRYKVKYMNKLKSVKMDWLPVPVITSETRILEKKKQQLVKAKNVKECNLRESRSSTNEGMSGEDKNEIRQPEGQKGKKIVYRTWPCYIYRSYANSSK